MSGRIISKGISISSVYDGRDGADGTSPWVADFNNEMDSVSCDDTGRPVEQQSVSTILYLYHGSSKSNFKVTKIRRTYGNGTAYDFTSNNTTSDGVTVNLSAGFNTPANANTLTVTYSTSAKITGKDDFRVTLTDTSGGNSKELHFIVNGVVGDVYNLKTSVDDIHATRSGDNYVVGSSQYYDLRCGYTKNVNGTVTIVNDVNVNATANHKIIDSKYNIYFIRHLRSTGDWEDYWWKYTYMASSGTPPATHKTKVAILPGYADSGLDVGTYDAVMFVLSESTANAFDASNGQEPSSIIDRETVYVVADGKKGDTGDGGAVATVTPGSLGIQCDGSGFPLSGVTQNLTFKMKVGSADATVTGVEFTPVGSPTYSVSAVSGHDDQKKISIPTNAPSATLISGAPFLVTGIYGGKTYTANCTLALICSIKGNTGSVGKTGRWYYFAGKATSSSHGTYTMELTQAPYIQYGSDSNGKPEFWMLDNQGVEPDGGTMTATQYPWTSGQTQWTKMKSDQEYYIAKAFFGDYANFGSFIINKDWMISTNGKISATEYNNGAVFPAGSNTPAYLMFDPDAPQGTKTIYIGTSLPKSVTSSSYELIGDQFALPNRYNIIRVTARIISGGGTLTIGMADFDNNVFSEKTVTATANTTVDFGFYGNRNPYGYFKLFAKVTTGTASIRNVQSISFAPQLAIDGLTGRTYQNESYIKGQLSVGSDKYIEINPQSSGAQITGYVNSDANNPRLVIGFDGTTGYMKVSYDGQQYVEVYNSSTFSGVRFTKQVSQSGQQSVLRRFLIGVNGNGKIVIDSPEDTSVWKTENEAITGEVYMDSSGFLKVKRNQ